MSNHSCIEVLLGSKELKKILVERSFQYNIPFKRICKKIDVDYRAFLGSYLNSHEGDPSIMTEAQFKEMMGMLGVKVRYQFVIDSEFDHHKIKELLNE